MKIKKIEIEGFKSYSTYQSLEKLDSQFNAITGLNGSGKSNVLDSICFLLGITQLGYIRAEHNDDLIFKKGQAGVTKATVTITFDNTDPKQKPVGYEAENEIVIKRQLAIGGKSVYHVNGISAGAKKLVDLFTSCSLNVNNPHFLIMQGRVTKVLNMKPKEILLMVEEAAGVRMYEAKKRIALQTIEKKDVKIAQMNKMMNEEILPRLEKMRTERDLYNEYQQLGRNIQKTEQTLIALQWWNATQNEIKMGEIIERQRKENEESGAHLETLKETLAVEENELKGMEEKKEGEMAGKKREMDDIVKQHDSARTDIENELAQKDEQLKEHNANMKKAEREIKEDKTRLQGKEAELRDKNNKLGNEAQVYADAEKKRQQCEQLLNALERNLVTDEEGREVSVQQQLMEMKKKLSEEEFKEQLYNQRLTAFGNDLKAKESELASMSNRRSVNNLELQRDHHKQQIDSLNAKLADINVDEGEGARLLSNKRQLDNEITQMRDKARDISQRYWWLHFSYRHSPHLDPNNIIGTLAKLIRVRDPQFATALEIALGASLQNIVVRTGDTAKALLKFGQLERRTTFIPLDRVQRIDDRNISQRFSRAQQIVGANNVWRAIDLVDFDPEIRPAIEFALGRVFVCSNENDAKAVCFDNEVKLRVVTIEGDDYSPGGTITGGAKPGKRTSCLNDLLTLRTCETRLAELEKEQQEIDERRQQISEALNECEQLKSKIESARVDLNGIENDLQYDPVAMVRAKIAEFKAGIDKNTRLIEALRPTIEQLRERVHTLEDRQRNEHAYRESERKRAQDGKREAERILSKGDSERARQQLELLEMDVEECRKQLIAEEAALKGLEDTRDNLRDERKEIADRHAASKAEGDKAKAAFEEFHKKYKEHDNEIREKQQYIQQIKKTTRSIETVRSAFDHDHADAKKKQARFQKEATEIKSKNSWIVEECEHFNMPDTQYDFKDQTPDRIKHEINDMRERRGNIEKRVNVTAMKSLTEEEERVSDLDGKRRTLENDRELLNQTMFEIDAEKKRELETAVLKISKDFGNIFSTILPGAQSKLQQVDAEELKSGLQICVGFNNKWKDALDELSGGQRSLVALSLILAMLKCNPAPIYILDEVDAALDVSHTANIGTMIKQHFKESQFIIVSLKEGMFNNANVLYRTQFVNGTSQIRRFDNSGR